MRVSRMVLAILLTATAPAFAQDRQDRPSEAAPANLQIEHPGEPFALSGLYEVTAQAGREASSAQNPRAGEAVFSTSVRLPDGAFCQDWTVRRSAEVADEELLRIDPALAGLSLDPAGERGMVEDARLMRMLEVRCEDEPLAWLIQIDERVLVQINEAGAFLVLERPLDAEAVAALQRNLAAAGFNPGPADGIMGRQTRNAMAAYAASRASVAGPLIGAATVNLLEGAAFSAQD